MCVPLDTLPGVPYKEDPNIAGVVKLVDARDSKSRGRKPMRVRFSPPAPKNLEIYELRR